MHSVLQSQRSALHLEKVIPKNYKLPEVFTTLCRELLKRFLIGHDAHIAGGRNMKIHNLFQKFQQTIFLINLSIFCFLVLKVLGLHQQIFGPALCERFRIQDPFHSCSSYRRERAFSCLLRLVPKLLHCLDFLRLVEMQNYTHFCKAPLTTNICRGAPCGKRLVGRAARHSFQILQCQCLDTNSVLDINMPATRSLVEME
mmetsp:Transcript_58231/g.109712  ORF Transcript_58231/g.109712 Transcript_58231/m.109712 type:complete len:200 (+) Transcript_58231:251-850(+)